MASTLEDCFCEACSWESNRRWLEERSQSWGGSKVEPPTEDMRCVRTKKVIVKGVKAKPKGEPQSHFLDNSGKTMDKLIQAFSALNTSDKDKDKPEKK
ncbi:hypothetical protein RB595_007991 [Gaeumannomyces hyphopodioides]